MLSHWELDGSIEYFNSINVTMNANHTLNAVSKHYQPPSVGGIYIPVNKLGLLAPYIALASTILVATAIIAIYVKHIKHRKEKH